MQRVALEVSMLKSGSDGAGGEKNHTCNIVHQEITAKAKGLPYKTATKTQDIKYADFSQFQSSLRYQQFIIKS